MSSCSGSGVRSSMRKFIPRGMKRLRQRPNDYGTTFGAATGSGPTMLSTIELRQPSIRKAVKTTSTTDCQPVFTKPSPVLTIGVTIDETGTTVKGVRRSCHVVGTPLFFAYFTLETKGRRGVLQALQGGGRLASSTLPEPGNGSKPRRCPPGAETVGVSPPRGLSGGGGPGGSMDTRGAGGRPSAAQPDRGCPGVGRL